MSPTEIARRRLRRFSARPVAVDIPLVLRERLALGRACRLLGGGSFPVRVVGDLQSGRRRLEVMSRHGAWCVVTEGPHE